MTEVDSGTQVQSLEVSKGASVEISEVDSISPSQSSHESDVNSETVLQLQLKQIDERYAQERDKRIRPDGKAQYTYATSSPEFKHFVEDCWVKSDPPRPALRLQNNDHHKVIIVGAGFGGLLYAVRLIEAGFSPGDLAVVDTAGGFGGTWYWNRYPGLMCDTEAYIYMPLLEETGYMPRTKYAYGTELREHADRIAKQWQLEDRAVFSTNVQQIEWDQEEHRWNLDMVSTSDSSRKIHATADFVIIASGILHKVKVSDHGIGSFHGSTMHTARWNYSLTGGSPYDPSLTKLRDKKVGIIGTGATAVQIVPHLAKWSKELYVFQRTPASVDVRGQRATDEKWWADNIQRKKGWQRERSRNFIDFTLNAEPAPAMDMVQDGWTAFPSVACLIGTDRAIAPADVPAYIAKMRALDLPRSERIRARTDEVVTDKQTADSLKPWFYGWCKRPTFHDDYLPAFNLPSVTLVDTLGKGIESVDQRGIVANGRLYDLDIIIYSTGYDLELKPSPAGRANIVAIGRNGQKLEDKWTQGVRTLHGIITRDFPNLFFTGISQGASSANLTSSLDIIARHTAFIMAAAVKQAAGGQKVTVEPTAAAEEAWANSVVVGAPARAPAMGCTPSLYNAESARLDLMPPEVQARALLAIPYPFGLNKFEDLLDKWHQKGDLSELQIQLV